MMIAEGLVHMLSCMYVCMYVCMYLMCTVCIIIISDVYCMYSIFHSYYDDVIVTCISYMYNIHVLEASVHVHYT